MNVTARLVVALFLTALVALFEAVGGFVAHSVALLSDAAHVAMDVLALGIALAARAQASRPATARQSYGFARLEVLAALGNGALLFTVTAFIVVEAIHRLNAPTLADGRLMAIVAAAGLGVNVLVGLALTLGGSGSHHHSHQHDHGHTHGDQSINLRAALLHVIGDALGGVAAVCGGLAILFFHVLWIDPILSLGVAAIIIVGIFRIVREAIHVLLESAPSHADIPTVRAHLLTIPGLVDVHDLHIWTLSGAEHVLSAHVLLEDRSISEASTILRTLEAILSTHYAITHVTIQFECEPCEEGDRILCTQRATRPG